MTKRQSQWTHVAYVASESEEGVSHEIKRNRRSGRLGCDCTAYRFARATHKTCKHIDALLVGEAVQPFPKMPTGALVQPTTMQAEARITIKNETFTVRRAIAFGGL
jgi:hypothetical protein